MTKEPCGCLGLYLNYTLNTEISLQCWVDVPTSRTILENTFFFNWRTYFKATAAYSKNLLLMYDLYLGKKTSTKHSKPRM